ncbi:hypothetical protein [Absidia glauca]|uniref:PHD-type domain-containing protein n=1 Tax=Absidia glauca TaxID=4829 RepID=A0A163IS86_ABSGL|nr:hypothetical protein [Absidia glauca]
MAKGRPRKSVGLNKVDLTTSTTGSSTPEGDDPGLRRSSRKRRSSTYQEEDDLVHQQSKRRKDEIPIATSEEPDHGQEHSDIDEAGEKKIDRYGNLQDERAFKSPTFTLPTRGETVLMLAMEPAKILGFRDSHIFFNKNPSLERVRLTEEEKDILVERGMVLSWFRHRDVAVVTARSVFKRFGAKIIKKGKRCRDDYYEAKAREQGYTGESTMVEKKSELMALRTMEELFAADYLDDSLNHSRRSLLNNNNNNGNSSKNNTYEDDDTSSDTDYTTTATLTDQTWIHYAALGTRGFNSQLRHCRDRKSTFYDAHTNINQVRASTQARKCEWISHNSLKDSPHVSITFDSTSSSDEKEANTTLGYSYLSYGNYLMDYTKANDILDSLPTHLRSKVEHLIKPPSYLSSNKDETEYPIALAENQYQDSFPIHFTRFGMNQPNVQGPATVIGKTQSMMAQQHYLNQVYQYVNHTKGLLHGGQLGAPSSPFWSQTVPKASAPSMAHPTAGTDRHQQHEQHIEQKSPEKQGNGIKNESHQAKTSVKSAPDCAECHQIHAPTPTIDSDGPLCDVFYMVPCSKCQRAYHPSCANLTTPKQLAAVESYRWSCPECKICCVCTSAGDETKLMICDGCDRGWHTDCCTPPVNEIPEDMSDDTDSDRFHAIAPPTDNVKFPLYLATYCGPCYTNFDEDRFCPVCLRSYTDGDDVADADKEMVACDACDRWVHSRCDATLTPERYQQLCDDENAKYSCPLCGDRVKAIDPDSSIATMALQGLIRPSGVPIGLVGEKVKTRGLVEYKSYKLSVPEISGTESIGLLI